jgi:hypothetical protein
MRVFLTVKERNELRKYVADNAVKKKKLSQYAYKAWVQKTFGKDVGRSTIGKIIN